MIKKTLIAAFTIAGAYVACDHRTQLAETFTATSIVATSTITTPTYVVNGTGLPTITVCNANPPTAVQPAGSLCMNPPDITAPLYTSAGGGVWAKVGSAGSFTQVLNVPGSTLVGWNQRTGVWTANPLAIDTGTAESYLSYESGGTTAAPQAQSTFIAQARIAFTAGSSATTDAGFVIIGGTGAVGSSNIRAFFRRNGQEVGVDVFGASLLISANPGLADFGIGNYQTFRVVKTGRDFDLYINGTLYLSATIDVGGSASLNDARWGLWTNPGHAEFQNIQEWALTTP